MNKENNTPHDEDNKKQVTIRSMAGEGFVTTTTKSKRIKPDRAIMYFSSSNTQIKVNLQEVKPFLEPEILCFCKKPAFRYDTPEYGGILDCASYDEASPHYNPRFVCGFHVHERSWLKVRLHILNGFPIFSEYRELFTCPLYNFTYCSFFNVVNDYCSMPLTTPKCFCNRPTILDYEHKGGCQKFNQASTVTSYIACSNRNIPGAPKCNYWNPSVVTVFPKSKYQIHRISSYM